MMSSPIYLEFLSGKRELTCTAWGNPTRNVKGWKGPCYLITDEHHETFDDLMENTDWDNYGYGKDPRCEHCMVHCGYEPSARPGRQQADGRQSQNAHVAALLMAMHNDSSVPCVVFALHRESMYFRRTHRYQQRLPRRSLPRSISWPRCAERADAGNRRRSGRDGSGPALVPQWPALWR